jgi:thiol-disulfide isomerase/thioredoxin
MWATWCTPCVKELPSLSRLKELRPDIEVVALSHDTAKTPPQLRAFLDKYAAKNLEVFYDPHMKLQALLPTRGIPTTFLISPSGQIFNKVEGDIDWSSQETLALIDQTGAVQ